MTCPIAKDTAIIIPARNEEGRIGACLTALAGQCTARVCVILVVNNSTDCTSVTACDIAEGFGLDLTVLERELAPHEGVGLARKIGCDHALRNMPDLRYLLTTDADCIIAPDWIARNLAHLETVDAVCGKVDLITGEASILDGMDTHLATLEGIYRGLVQDIYARHARGCEDISGTHGEAAGASLAFSKAAYLAVGGFAQVRCGEDRRIVRELRTASYKVCHADDVKVQASCRLTGRAAGGMSDALMARISGMNYLIDDCLPSANWLVRHASGTTLGPWPPHVPARFRLHVQDLPRHIEILENFENSERLISASIVRAAATPCSHLGMPAPNKESAIALADSDPQTCRAPEERMSVTTQTNGSAIPTAKGA